MDGAEAQWGLRLMPGPLGPLVSYELGPGPSGEQGPCSELWFRGDLRQPAYWKGGAASLPIQLLGSVLVQTAW